MRSVDGCEYTRVYRAGTTCIGHWPQSAAQHRNLWSCRLGYGGVESDRARAGHMCFGAFKKTSGRAGFGLDLESVI